MRYSQRILSALLLFFTLQAAAQSTLAFAFDFQLEKPKFNPIKDIYPDRQKILNDSFTICRETLLKENVTTSQIQQSVEKYFLKNPKSVSRVESDTGWTVDIVFPTKAGGFLRILKNENYFTFGFRQNEEAIESIASITLANNCRDLSDARFVFFNEALRAILKVKLNSKSEEVYRVVMEEAVANVTTASADPSSLIRLGVH